MTPSNSTSTKETMASPAEGLRLVEAFRRIQSASVRTALIKLTERMAARLAREHEESR